MASEDRTQITADIVAAHVSNNAVAVGDVPTLIQKVHEALSSLSGAAEGEKQEKEPAVAIRSSVKPDYLVCLECGRRQKTLRRHLQSAHGITPEQYREDYGLPADYPMTAPTYSEQRREMAKKIGLGRKPGEKRSPRKRRKAKAESEAYGTH